MFRYPAPEEEHSRVNTLQWFCKTTLRYSQAYNHIYTTADELKGIAAWLPPGHSPLSLVKLLQLGLYALPFKLGWRKMGQFLSLFFLIDEFHERDMPRPHWYLFILSVTPTYQGQGIGSLLLQPILYQADSKALPCYLETFSEKAVRFYQKNGFEVLRTAEFAKGSPQLWIVKREPQ